MHFSTIFSTAALMGSALAADHIVKVGNAKSELIFDPSNVKAAEGDTVTFHFYPKNHSIAQSSFAKPCEPLDKGFWSGYVPTQTGMADNTFVYEVKNASAPVWFYCTQGKHCQNGMVGAINAKDTGNTVDKFKEAAKGVANNVEPKSDVTGGKIVPMNASSTSPSASSSASGTAASASASPTGNAASSLQVGSGLMAAGAFAVLSYML